MSSTNDDQLLLDFENTVRLWCKKKIENERLKAEYDRLLAELNQIQTQLELTRKIADDDEEFKRLYPDEFQRLKDEITQTLDDKIKSGELTIEEVVKSALGIPRENK
jgi:predicted nuclease with TOPRIM domain